MSESEASPATEVFTTGSTWRAVGLEMTTEDRADEVLAQASDKCTPVVGDTENGVFHYEDRSGAVVVFDVIDGAMADIHQGFNATNSVSAQWVEMADRYILADILTGDGNDVAGQACVALRGGLLNKAGRGASGQLKLAALASRAELYASAAEYADSETASTFAQADDANPKAPADTLPTFISMGAVSVLQQKGAHAGGVLAGKISAAEMHSNTLTGENFWVIETNVGFPLTVCVAESDLDARPRPGNVIAGEFLILAHTV